MVAPRIPLSTQQCALRDHSLFDPARLRLRAKTKFRGAKSVFLSHRVLGPVQAVKNQLAEKWEADLTMASDVIFAGMIDEEKVVAFEIDTDVEVFA